MKHRVLRFIPALATLLLLAAALVAPAARVRAKSGPSLDSYFNPACDLVLQSGSYKTTRTLTGTEGLAQPILLESNAAACTLGLNAQGYGPSGAMYIVKWDPATMAPDPTVVALRSMSYNPSALQYTRVRLDFDPPIVLRETPGVAEPLGFSLAINYWNTGSTYTQTARYDDDGPAQIPGARLLVNVPPVTSFPLAGNHPVLDHRVCGGNSTLQALQVTQSVVRGDQTLGGPTMYEAVQRLRVAVPTDLRWIEFPLVSGPIDSYSNWGLISIYDATGQDEPPLSFTNPITQVSFSSPYPLGRWATHFDLDDPVQLAEEHDYWVVFRTVGSYNLKTRTLTGAENVWFKSRIGPLFRRDADGAAWTPLADQALNFRVIGVPLGSTAVGPRTPARASLALTVHPSPSRGPVAISWTGARADLRFEVLDARGRRVAGGAAAASETGRWTWNAAGEGGRALPAGVYFVRAIETGGRSASQRVVLVR